MYWQQPVMSTWQPTVSPTPSLIEPRALASKLSYPSRQEYDALQKRLASMPKDTLLDYSILDKVFHSLKSNFIVLPKTVWRGLKGADDFTFSESMQVAKVPYILGGLFLTLSPLVVGNKRQGVRQGVAVALYMLGNALAGLFVNKLYQARYGVDLSMLYRTKAGHLENVFASSDFPRFDLLTPRHYERMEEKMNIPEWVPERDGVLREHVRHMITTSRTLKLLLGTLFSAIGAGYLARSDAWLELPGAIAQAGRLLVSPKLGWFKRFQLAGAGISEALRKPIIQQLSLSAAKPVWQRALLVGGMVSVVASALFVWFNGIPKKNYFVHHNPLFAGSRPPEIVTKRRAV